jgi:hypothetical protein
MADTSNTVVHIAENSPEQVALKLLEKVAAVEKRQFYGHGDNPADRKWILETYDECLKVVKGYR